MKTTHLTALALASVIAAQVDGGQAVAESAGVETLLQQAKYWETRGQHNRAKETYKRVLELDPQNAVAKQALEFNAAKTVLTVPVASKTTQEAPQTTDKKPGPARSMPAPKPNPAGDARAAGFKALEAGNLDLAETSFNRARSLSPKDSDVLGGLGVVQLRRNNFSEAKDLLGQARKLGHSDKWDQAYASADFFARVSEASAALEARELDTALSISENLVRSGDGDQAIAYGLLSDVLDELGRYSEAAQAARTALRMPGLEQGFADQLRMNALRREAIDASQQGRTVVAEKLFQDGMTSYPNDPWIRYEYARFLNGQGNSWQARAMVTSLAASTDAEHLYAAALLSEQLDMPGEAQDLIRRIPDAARTPEMQEFVLSLTAQTAIDRAQLLAKQGKTAQAVSGLKQIAATGRLPAYRQAEIAGVLYDLGDRSDAVTMAQNLMKESLSDPAAYEPIVRILTSEGQTAFSYGAIQRAAEAAGDSPEKQAIVERMRRMMAVIEADNLREVGNYAQSYEVLQTAWQTAPGDTDVLMSLARLYQAGGMALPAARTLQMVLQQEPQNKDALLVLVDTASAAGDADLARTAFEHLETLDPDNYEIFLAAARMEKQAGRDRAARKYLEKARELYQAQTGEVGGGGFSSTNPFANRAMGGNPFAASAAPNPFDTKALVSSNTQSANPWQLASASTGPAYGQAQTTPSTLPGRDMPGMQTISVNQNPGGFGLADPVLVGIAADLAELDAETGPRINVSTHYRDRSGESGLSALNELGGTVEYSTGFGGGRAFVAAHAVSIDAGEVGENSQLKFGRNDLLQARGIVGEYEAVLADPGTQHEAGVELTAGYRGEYLNADVGVTPLGFQKTRAQGGISYEPKFGQYTTGKAWVEYRPVTDSVLSYAGTTDPVTGEFWGAVMRSEAGVSLSYERDGSGFYAEGSYAEYAGESVKDNKGMQLNAGGYLLAHKGKYSDLSVGVNGNYQAFDDNHNLFTSGYGGYFSPQSFLSVSFPIRYAYTRERLEAKASITPGYQSFEQDREPFYPTDPAAMFEVGYLAFLNEDVQAYHDSSSETGFGVNLNGSTYFQVAPGTSIGGEVRLNTFGEYNEFQTLFGIRQNFGAFQ
ncbi:cellulose synthase subunit BcsC-related outer membrane protein [Hyphomonas pacifica]|uniref:Cellulose synthase operon C C-terminal domain-containing protein n=1 Tax=Hyphomonas pacifica TaxID=1280941 RepID=A0A062TP52_9PROT|nr:cellulose synthase subunit BcsC-related outer membrane protein [Hyphomonas pacifica]KCZ47442.1 hypothetical protein HY2_04820 [Hyphomonas pacifica]RAN31359.1 hypothetical protein HY3_04520 [Hyphomonas pacifica]